MTTLFSPTQSQHQPLPAGTPPDRPGFTAAPSMGNLHRTPSSHFNNSQVRSSNRMSGEFTSRKSFSGNGNGPMAVPGQASPYQNGHGRNVQPMLGVPPFDLARSPPNSANKNTKHVPCKFFRQGACQAGQACPFLHSTDTTIDTAPCKYFSKGNCKFGAKCALAHILPDGRQVNRNNMGMVMGRGHLNIGGRVNPPVYHPQDSALANSLLTQQQMNGMPYSNYPYMMGDEYSDRQYDNLPTIGVDGGSNPTSKYGSPTEDNRLPMSPVGHHLSALDAPLPASFDSNGISYIARHGPVAASVPSKFAIDSPPASLPQRSGAPSDAIKALHDAAYANMRNISSNVASSPPATTEPVVTPRILHSQRITRPKPVSASLPRAAAMDDWDEGFALEEDLLPTNLHDDVLTPQEKARRTSRSEQEVVSSSAPRDMAGPRGIPSANSSKVGSPIASSPSRFAGLFAKQRQQREGDPQTSIGHVGSPLRESLLSQRPGPSVSVGTRWASEESAPSLQSPPRQSPMSSMSTLSQQLRSMQMKRTESSESNGGLHPAVSSARHSSIPGGRFDRTVSSPGLTTSRIDEEASDLVFSMEEEETSKRNSAAWASGKSPEIRPIG